MRALEGISMSMQKKEIASPGISKVEKYHELTHQMLKRINQDYWKINIISIMFCLNDLYER